MPGSFFLCILYFGEHTFHAFGGIRARGGAV
jgi:hypothetical protein